MKEEEMNPLLENARDSIQMGLEDFESEDSRRAISAARNFYSGVLLLCKEVLRQLSPPDSNEVLIHARKKFVRGRDGNIGAVGEGNMIDRDGIERTFNSLNIPVNLKKLERLADIRNNIEHKYFEHGADAIKESIAIAMPIIQEIIEKELGKMPVKLLGQKAWSVLLRQADIYEQNEKSCQHSFKDIKWEDEDVENLVSEFKCPHCKSGLVRKEDGKHEGPNGTWITVSCLACGKSSDIGKVVEVSLGESLYAAEYISFKDGGEEICHTCPECELETYVIPNTCADLETESERCLNPECRYVRGNEECSICGERLTVDELLMDTRPYCGYHDHMMSKDD